MRRRTNRASLRLLGPQHGPLAALLALTVCLASAQAVAQTKVYLNPSDQDDNEVSGGGVESQYALIIANKVEAILDATGFDAKVDQDFTNAPSNANSWGAEVFVSIHSNAGGGHGTETLYVSNGGKTLAQSVQTGLVDQLPYADRGLKQRTDLHVLNSSDMYACLTETVFHDCTTTSGQVGHPPSESAFLQSAAGQTAIAQGIANGICAYFGVSCSDGGTTPVDPPPVTTSKGWLKGVVYKAPNLQDRIAGATVKLSNGQSVVVGETGLFQFELAPGTYTITASANGYQTGTLQRTVVANQEEWGSIGLTAVSTTDNDPDKDGVPTASDNCPTIGNSDQVDSDGDGVGDACETSADTDGDGIADSQDNCPLVFNPTQADADGNGVGNACQSGGLADSDGDGIADSVDNCPAMANAGQADSDKDGIGDVCDTGGALDSDGDGIADANDNCTMKGNANQQDSDDDGVGDACDPFPYVAAESDVVSEDDGACGTGKTGAVTCPPCTSECTIPNGSCAAAPTASSSSSWAALAALAGLLLGILSWGYARNRKAK